ncbi:MAG: pantothenate kinase, partial [Cyanobacteria bacterium P01_A01_bin.40]
AALPQITLPDTLPPRWADNTEQAIASGIIYTTISGIQSFINDWWRQFTDNQVLFTGGDAKALSLYLYSQFPELKQKTIVDPNLIFHGIKLVYEERQKQQP